MHRALALAPLAVCLSLASPAMAQGGAPPPPAAEQIVAAPAAPTEMVQEEAVASPAAPEEPFALRLGVDVGVHAVLNTWPLFDQEVALGTGTSSAMYALRASGALARWPAWRAELGLAVLPFDSTLERANTAVHYSLDLFYVARQWTRQLLGGAWTPQAGAGLGLYHNLRGDLGRDADPTLHAALALRGEYGRYGFRVTVRNYLSDWIAGHGPGDNLEVSVGVDVFTGYVPPDPEPVVAVAAPAREIVVVQAPAQPVSDDEPSDRPVLTVEEKRKRDEATAKIQGTVLRFSTGGSNILPEHDMLLRTVAELLRQHRWIRLVIVGYADSDGNEAKNVTLSTARAETIRDRLAQLGVDGSRLLAVAAGEKNPFAGNEDAEGRSENRRVELHVLSR